MEDAEALRYRESVGLAHTAHRWLGFHIGVFQGGPCELSRASRAARAAPSGTIMQCALTPRTSPSPLNRHTRAAAGLTSMAFSGMFLGVLFVGGALVSGGSMTPGQLMAYLLSTQTTQRSLGG